MPKAYEGKEPYIFVSYSHRDQTEVMRYIDALQSKGYRIWFDGGIEAGSEWPEYIADHLDKSACLLAFISSDFVESKNCRREVNLAQELNKDLLNVYIEEVDLSLGMRMQLGLNQAIWKKNFESEAAFIEALAEAKIISRCKAAQTVKEPVAAAVQPEPQPIPVQPKPALEPENDPVPTVSKQEQTQLLQRSKRTGWIGSILELLYAPISLWLMYFLTDNSVNGWYFFFALIILHTTIALINKVSFNSVGKALDAANMKRDKLYDASLSVLLCTILSSVISVFGGIYVLYPDRFFLLNLLAALAFNIVPFIIAGGISLFLTDK